MKAAHRLFHARRRRATPLEAAHDGPPQDAHLYAVVAGGGRRQAAEGGRQCRQSQISIATMRLPHTFTGCPHYTASLISHEQAN